MSLLMVKYFIESWMFPYPHSILNVLVLAFAYPLLSLLYVSFQLFPLSISLFPSPSTHLLLSPPFSISTYSFIIVLSPFILMSFKSFLYKFILFFFNSVFNSLLNNYVVNSLYKLISITPINLF